MKNPMSFQGFIRAGDHSLYAEHQPARESFPTLVLLNGLSMSSPDWDSFLRGLSSSKHGILRLDFRGQGQSLRRELEDRGGFERNVTVEEQSQDVRTVLDHLRIEGPLVLIGTSYGGGVGIHFATRWAPQVRKIILLVPYLIRLDHAFPLQRGLASQLEAMRGFGWIPGGFYDAFQHSYHQFLSHYMDYRYGRQVPDPLVRKATIHLTFGIMGYNALSSLACLPTQSVHLISGGRDTLVPSSLYREMWRRLPAESRESWLYIEDGEHLLLDQAPLFCARWVEMILADDPRLRGGRRFSGQAYSFEIFDQDHQRLRVES